MTDKLNVKQEKFVQGLIKGLSQRQAYKEAYEVDYDDNAIDINASKLFNSAKVKLRYNELLNKIEDESIMSAKERQKWLSAKIKEPGVYTQDKLRALDILNKMTGEYTQRIEANVNTEIRVQLDD